MFDINTLSFSHPKLETSLTGPSKDSRHKEYIMARFCIELNENEKCVMQAVETKSNYSALTAREECITWLELVFETGAEE